MADGGLGVVAFRRTAPHLVHNPTLGFVQARWGHLNAEYSLITRAQVMTDQIAALTLARLHAAGLLPAGWVAPAEVRELRAA